MSQNKNYRIMKFFQQIDKSSNAKGYIRLETRGTRCTYSVSVEGISDRNDISDVYLFKNNGEKVRLGSIKGRKGKFKKNVSLNEFTNHDESIENFNICVIIKDKKPVLSAMLFNEEKIDYNTLTAEKPEKAEDIKKEDISKKVKESCSKENNKPVEQVNVEQKKEETDQKVESKEKQRPNNLSNLIYDRLSEFEKVKPLKDKIKGLEWWKINYDHNSIYKGFLPFFNKIITIYYPYPLNNRVTTCQNLMKKHGFYLFGVYEENNKITKYVYGIPGKFTREEQPYRGITGFKNWSYKTDNIAGDFGFWLAFINAHNGEITEPPKVD